MTSPPSMLTTLSALTFACNGVVNQSTPSFSGRMLSQHRVAQLPDWRLLGPGHCGPTAASERCDVGQHGGWSTKRTKITSLEQSRLGERRSKYATTASAV